MESGGSSYAFNATCGGSATATRCVYILFKKTDDSSIENDDSFLENDDSSIENDDSSLETDDSCSNAWGLSLTLRLAACGITLVSRTGWGSVLPRCVLKIDFRLLSDFCPTVLGLFVRTGGRHGRIIAGRGPGVYRCILKPVGADGRSVLH